MTLPATGPIHMGALADNNSSASRQDLVMSTLSNQFASGSLVGDVDGNSTANQTADRDALKASPFALSEFRGANIPNASFDSVEPQLANGTDVTSNGYVDGDSAQIEFGRNNTDLGPNFTAGVKAVSNNAILASDTANLGTATGTQQITFTAPTTAEADDKYYAFVSTGTFENATGATINHYTAIANGVTRIKNTSGTITELVYVSASDDSVSNIVVDTLANTGTQVSKSVSQISALEAGNGGTISTTFVSQSTVNTTYSIQNTPGKLRFTTSHVGNPSKARNETTSTRDYDVRYAQQIISLQASDTTVNVSAVDGSNNVTITCTSRGRSGTVTIGHDDNSTPSDKTFTSVDEAVSTVYFEEAISKNFTISSAGTYYPKAFHDSDSVAYVGSSITVAPQLSFNTTGNDSISINGTSHVFKATSVTGNNVGITISNTRNSTTTTDYGTGYSISPGTADGIYTVTYTATSNYSQSTSPTDTLNVYPDAAFTVNSGDTTLLINAPAGSGLSNDSLSIIDGSVGDNISAYSYTITKDGGNFLDGDAAKTYTTANVAVHSTTLDDDWGTGTYNVDLLVTGGGSLQNTQTGNDAFTISNHPPQTLTIVNPGSVHIARRGTATSITWTKQSATAVTIKSYKASSAIDTISSGNTGTSTSWTPDGGDTLGTDWRIYGSVDSGTATDFSSYFTLKDGLPTTPTSVSDSNGNESAGVSWTDGSYNGSGNTVYIYSNSAGTTLVTSATTSGTSYTYNESIGASSVTRYFRVSGTNLSSEESTKSGVTNGATLYPNISDEFSSADISISVNPVIVGSNTVLSVGNVTDNIVGYKWALTSGTGTMTSNNVSGGDIDGTSTDGTTIIDETSAATNTVSFNTAQSSKTITLYLYGRLSQTETATKTISVELADAVTINSISSVNYPTAITVAGTQAGLQYGVVFGLVTSAASTTFIPGKSTSDSADSRYVQDNYTSNITPADQTTTQTLQGRVVDRLSNGNPGSSTTANTSNFTYYPELKNTRNVINPNRNTIYSTTRNNDTGNYPTSVSYSTPSTATDNVTSRTYSTTALTGHTFGNGSATSHAATTTTYGGGTAIGSRTVTLAIAGNLSQTSSTTHTVTVNYMPRIYDITFTSGTIVQHSTTLYIKSITWQGFNASDFTVGVYSSSGGGGSEVGSVSPVTIADGEGGAAELTNNCLDNDTGGAQKTGTLWTHGIGVSCGTISTSGTVYLRVESNSGETYEESISVQAWNSVLLAGHDDGGSPPSTTVFDYQEDAANPSAYHTANSTNPASVTVYYLGTLGSGTIAFKQTAGGSAFNGQNGWWDMPSTRIGYIDNSGNMTSGNYITDANAKPFTPTGIGSSATTTSITVTWTDASNIEDNYYVFYKAGSSNDADYNDTAFGGNAYAAGTQTAIQSSGISSNQAYSVAVYAKNGTAYSDPLRKTFSTPAGTSWSSVFASFTDNGGSPSSTRTTAAKTLVLNNGSGNTTISRTTSDGITVAYSTNGSSYSGFGTSHTFSFTSGTLYVKFQKTFSKFGGSFTDTFRFTNNSVSVDRNVTMTALDGGE